jgi:ABC-type amino acid transport substrate-binding protein
MTRKAAETGLTRREVAVGLALAAAGAGLTGARAVADDDLSLLAPEIQAIKRKGKLVVGLTKFDSPPFYYVRNGAAPSDPPVGYDVELAQQVARGLDVPLVFDRRAEDFNRVVDFVVRGEVDMATSKLSLTPKRAVSALFSRPTIDLRHALLANRVRLAQLENGAEAREVINRGFAGSIGVIAGSSFADIARQLFNKARIEELKTWDDVVAAVNDGAVDVAYRDELEIKRVMRLKPELHLNVRSVLISDKRDFISAAFPCRSEQLGRLTDVVIAARRRLDANQLLDAYADIFAA